MTSLFIECVHNAIRNDAATPSAAASVAGHQPSHIAPRTEKMTIATGRTFHNDSPCYLFFGVPAEDFIGHRRGIVLFTMDMTFTYTMYAAPQQNAGRHCAVEELTDRDIRS